RCSRGGCISYLAAHKQKFACMLTGPPPYAGLPGIARPPSYRRSQRVSAAAINSPAPISKARAIPPRTDRTWWRRLAGLVLAAAVCAAKRPIQKLLMHQPKFMSYEDVRQSGPGPRIHPKSSETRIASVRIGAYEFEWDARPSS